MKKMVGRIARTISFVLLFTLVFLVLSAKASGGEPSIFGYQVKVVVSGSMEPAIQTGSIIVNKLIGKNTSYKKGDIISFQAGDKVVTHRITDIRTTNTETMYQTKGDNNNAPDANYVLQQHIVGKYTGITIPKVGYVIGHATSKTGSALLLFIPGLLLVLSAGRSIFLAAKEVEAKSA